MEQKATITGVMILLVIILSNPTQQSDFPVLKDPYLGQKPPGMTPEVFAPGIIATCYHEHSSPAFSPDGKEVYWSVFFNFYGPQVIVMMTSENDLWKAPIGKPFFERRLSLPEIKKRAITVGNGFGDVYWVDAKIIEELKAKD